MADFEGEYPLTGETTHDMSRSEILAYIEASQHEVLGLRRELAIVGSLNGEFHRRLFGGVHVVGRCKEHDCICYDRYRGY